jgi:hypothetical protein
MTFEMITGARPFDHESKVSLLGMHVAAPIPKMKDRVPGANVPAEVEAIVTRLLAKDAAERFADAKELAVAIDSAAAVLAERGRIAEAPVPPSVFGARGSSPRASTADATGPQSAVATLPTEPAHGSPSQPGLASLVGASLGSVLRSAPSWVTPRLALVLTAALGGLVLAVVIVFAATGRPAAAPAASGPAANGASAAPQPANPPNPKVDEIVAAARAKIDKGDFATAIDELAEVQKQGADRTDVHGLLERAYMGTHNAPAAMREAGLWLASDPDAAADVRLEEDVRNAALLREAQADAFSLLESKMGTRGVDLLYDIAFGASGRSYPQAAARAKKSLELDEVRRRASPALAVVLAFREAKTCEQKRTQLPEARERGDVRMLALLQPYEATRGCGFFARSDCYPCMHKDHELADAIQAIQDRATKMQ